jgi:two-component system OmpR family sensor kinase
MKAGVRSVAGRLADFFSSIRFRLTLWFVVILAVVLAAFSAFIYITQSRDLQFDAVQDMQAKLTRLDQYFHSDAWLNSNISPADVPGDNGQSLLQPEDFIILTTPDGQVVQNWGATPQAQGHLVSGLLSAANQNRALSVYTQSASVKDQSNQTHSGDYLFVVAPVTRRDEFLGFLILGSPSPLTDQLRRLALTLLFGSLGMLALAFFAGLWFADRAMRPVRSITQTAQEISESDLNRRLNLGGRDELAQLAGTFDSMLSRLQRAFERQRQFVADASHELRTPLTIINLEVGRVLSGNRRPAELHHALEVVDLESTRMTRLVNDLMTLARMDSGQTILQKEELDLSDVALDAYERMQPLAERRNIALHVGDMPELPVEGDRQYLVQMVSNLIENAIKYSQPGGMVSVETEEAASAPSPAAVVKVSDTGPGIPAEHLPHLFERFYRVDASRERDAQEDSDSPTGTGLGLSIVSWIVRGHNGHISVDSEPGKGTTFEVTLPLLNGHSQS